MALTFPILQVSGDSITGFPDERAFHQALALTTDKAINAGFFKNARLIDAQLAEHRVQRLELEGRAGLLGWMKRGRAIKALELAPSGKLKLEEVKALVTGIIKNSSFWFENEDVEAVVGEVEAASTFSALIDLFG